MGMNATSSYHINTTDSSEENEDEYAELSKSLHTMSFIVYCLVFVLGVLGNGVVIWVTGFKMKKTVNTVWFLNLAVADFLFTAFLPLSAAYLAMDRHWPFGKFMCKLNETLSTLNIFASVFILVVISVDRCASVVWPIWAQNHRSVRKASFVCLGVWVVALILSAPYFIFRDILAPDPESNIFCYDNFALSDDYQTPSVVQLRHSRHQAMTITCFLLGFVVPFTIIVSCYAVIINRVRRRHTLKSSRTFKIIAAVIIIFFLCWAPYHIMRIIEVVHHTLTDRRTVLRFVVDAGMPIARNLAFINSCLNPLLYVFMGQDYKNQVRKSILKVLETAFQEEVSRSHINTMSMNTTEIKERSTCNTEV